MTRKPKNHSPEASGSNSASQPAGGGSLEQFRRQWQPDRALRALMIATCVLLLASLSSKWLWGGSALNGLAQSGSYFLRTRAGELAPVSAMVYWTSLGVNAGYLLVFSLTALWIGFDFLRFRRDG